MKKILTIAVSFLTALIVGSIGIFAENGGNSEPAVTAASENERIIYTDPGDVIVTDPVEKPDTKKDGDWEYYVNSGGTISVYSYFGEDETVTVPEKIAETDVTYIYNFAFLNTPLVTLNLPSSLKSVAPYALSGMSSCENIFIADGNESFKSVGGVLYSADDTLIAQYPIGRKDASFTIPETVLYIGSGAFWDCLYLEEIVLPSKLEFISSYAFASCASLEKCDIPATALDIYDYAFAGCTKMTAFVIPEGTETLYDNSYGHCTSLTEINIPESVVAIGNGVFAECSNLEKVNFSEKNSVKTIGEMAFVNCRKLLNVHIQGDFKVGYLTFGYVLNDYGEGAMLRDFVLYGQEGGELQTYAAENSVTFVAEGESLIKNVVPSGADENPVATQTKGNNVSKAQIAAIICGGLLILVIISLAVNAAAKKKRVEDDDEDGIDESGYIQEEDSDDYSNIDDGDDYNDNNE